MVDAIHPNVAGYGILAQELYMRLAFSQQLKQKVTSLVEKDLSFSQVQNFMQQRLKEIEMKENESN